MFNILDAVRHKDGFEGLVTKTNNNMVTVTDEFGNSQNFKKDTLEKTHMSKNELTRYDDIPAIKKAVKLLKK